MICVRFLSFFYLFCGICSAVNATDPNRVLLVLNERSPVSKSLGEYYAEKRSVPSSNICVIDLPATEEVSRTAFESKIRSPIEACLSSRSLQDQILYIVTTREVPLLISGDPGLVGDLSSVDSELTLSYRTLMGGDYTAYGRIENPFFVPMLDPGRSRVFRREEQVIYLVSRIISREQVDRADAAVASMISKVSFGMDLASQRHSYLQDRLRASGEMLEQMDHQVFFEDSSEALRVGTPLLGFMGILDDSYTAQALDDLQWRPGSLGYWVGWNDQLRAEPEPEEGVEESGIAPREVDSRLEAETGLTSAESGDPEPASTSSFYRLADSLLESGASASVFFVANPGQDGYPRPEVLFTAYLDGQNIVDSFYTAYRYLSWRHVLIADPFLSPFGSAEKNDEWRAEIDPSTGLPRLFSERRREQLIRKYRTSQEAINLLLRGEAALAKNNRDEAKRLLLESLQLDSSISETNRHLARLYRETEAFEDAVEFYEKVLTLEPASERQTREELASIYVENLGKYKEAVPHIEWLFSLEGTRNLGLIELWGRVMLELEQFDQLEALFARVLREHSPTPYFILEGLGRTALEREDWQLAEDFFSRALARAEEDGLDSSGVEQELAELEKRRQAAGVEVAAAASGTDSPVRADDPSRTISQSLDGAGSEAGVSERLTRRAQVLERVAPVYPAMAVKDRLEGLVVLRLLIDERGQLISTEKVSGANSLYKAAAKAVEDWRFAPRLENGRPEIDQINVAIRFELPKQEKN